MIENINALTFSKSAVDVTDPCNSSAHKAGSGVVAGQSGSDSRVKTKLRIDETSKSSTKRNDNDIGEDIGCGNEAETISHGGIRTESLTPAVKSKSPAKRRESLQPSKDCGVPIKVRSETSKKVSQNKIDLFADDLAKSGDEALRGQRKIIKSKSTSPHIVDGEVSKNRKRLSDTTSGTIRPGHQIVEEKTELTGVNVSLDIASPAAVIKKKKKRSTLDSGQKTPSSSDVAKNKKKRKVSSDGGRKRKDDGKGEDDIDDIFGSLPF